MDEKQQILSVEKIAKQEAKDRSENRLCPVINAARTIDGIYSNSLDIPTIAKGLINSTARVHDGNIREIEMILMTQAQTLDALFHRSLTQMINAEMSNPIQVFADIAFKAQNQSRKTLLALSAIKHPQQQTVVKQQNVAFNQQVNNDTTHGRHKINPENELLELEKNYGKRLDASTPSKAIKTYTQMETVAISGSKKPRRQSPKQNECL